MDKKHTIGGVSQISQVSNLVDSNISTNHEMNIKEKSPRALEVDLIKSLIKECFEKYGKPPKT